MEAQGNEEEDFYLQATASQSSLTIYILDGCGDSWRAFNRCSKVLDSFLPFRRRKKATLDLALSDLKKRKMQTLQFLSTTKFLVAFHLGCVRWRFWSSGLRVKLQTEWRVGGLTNCGLGDFLRIDGLKNILTDNHTYA